MLLQNQYITKPTRSIPNLPSPIPIICVPNNTNENEPIIFNISQPNFQPENFQCNPNIVTLLSPSPEPFLLTPNVSVTQEPFNDSIDIPEKWNLAREDLSIWPQQRTGKDSDQENDEEFNIDFDDLSNLNFDQLNNEELEEYIQNCNYDSEFNVTQDYANESGQEHSDHQDASELMKDQLNANAKNLQQQPENIVCANTQFPQFISPNQYSIVNISPCDSSVFTNNGNGRRKQVFVQETIPMVKNVNLPFEKRPIIFATENSKQIKLVNDHSNDMSLNNDSQEDLEFLDVCFANNGGKIYDQEELQFGGNKSSSGSSRSSVISNGNSIITNLDHQNYHHGPGSIMSLEDELDDCRAEKKRASNRDAAFRYRQKQKKKTSGDEMTYLRAVEKLKMSKKRLQKSRDLFKMIGELIQDIVGK